MLELEIKVKGKRPEALVNALKLVIAQIETGELAKYPLDTTVLDKSSLRIDGTLLAGLSGE